MARVQLPTPQRSSPTGAAEALDEALDGALDGTVVSGAGSGAAPPPMAQPLASNAAAADPAARRFAAAPIPVTVETFGILGQVDVPAVLTIDVGGTKLAAGIVDATGGVLLHRRRPTPATEDPEEIWAALDALVDDVLAAYGGDVAGAGIGCGGPMAWPAGAVSPINMPAWRGFPLRARVAERLVDRPVRLHNDAICVAVAEHWVGAGRTARGVLGMVVSTGVGGGLILDDRLVDGATGNAGHIGHVVVEPGGARCGCGGRGCLEAVARGPAVVAAAPARGWVGEPTGVALARSARAGDPIALDAFARAGRALGLALASAVALCDVEVVALGGGLARVGAPLWEPLRSSYAESARLPFSRRARVIPAALGELAGLIGPAALVLRGDRYWSAD